MSLLSDRGAARIRVVVPKPLHLLDNGIGLYLCIPRLVHRRLRVLGIRDLEIAHWVVLGRESTMLLWDVAVSFPCWRVHFTCIRAYWHGRHVVLRVDILH